jgi:hypothetical protein
MNDPAVTEPDPSRGEWFSTYTGRRWYVRSPRPEDVDLADVAHSLSMQCRFNGHCRDFYSVAQHSVLVSRLVRPELALHGLLDAAEAYVGDLVRPIKQTFRTWNVVAFDALESLAELAIFAQFGVRPPDGDEAEEIKRADLVALSTERRDLLKPGLVWRTTTTHPPAPETIRPMPPLEAEALFLARWVELRP